ncbi:MAG: DsbA family protein [Planctomycetes bacterium]|nr:DsbA family protein [Planctomycetota bacterium]
MTDRPIESSAIKSGPHAIGIIALLAAVVGSGMLVVQHIAGIALPGCGAGSPCAQLSASAWGKVPGIGWPVSHVGLAYFIGALIAWSRARSSGVSASFLLLARVGVLASVVFLIVMGTMKHFCAYCAIAHVGNFVFWLVLESSAKSKSATHTQLITAAVTFLVATLALAIAETQQKQEKAKEGEKQLADSTQKIADATTQKPANQSTVDVTPPKQSGATPAQPKRWPNGFTGRHRRGPESAPIRIVVLSDFQCPDCLRTEQDIAQLVERRNDISVAYRHFPMSTMCNPYVSMDLHGNACWAARAAEAAAILYGEEGFWKMHKWLFDNKGMFSDTNVLNAGVASLGFDTTRFVETMTSEETLARVREDIEDGNYLGLHYTPMVFINGVELKGVFAPQAVSRAVAAVLEKNPPSATCINDQPPPAIEKYFTDWRERPEMTLPRASFSHSFGAADGRVKVAVWADLQEPNSAKVDEMIRAFAAGRNDVTYDFHHYPVNMECNPSCGVTKHEKACMAHKAAIAAGMVGGGDAYWKLHIWLMSNQGTMNEASLDSFVANLGIDAAKWKQVAASNEVSQNLAEDAAFGKRLGFSGIPAIFINGKFVPRWIRGTDVVLNQMLAEAAK